MEHFWSIFLFPDLSSIKTQFYTTPQFATRLGLTVQFVYSIKSVVLFPRYFSDVGISKCWTFFSSDANNHWRPGSWWVMLLVNVCGRQRHLVTTHYDTLGAVHKIRDRQTLLAMQWKCHAAVKHFKLFWAILYHVFSYVTKNMRRQFRYPLLKEEQKNWSCMLCTAT